MQVCGATKVHMNPHDHTFVAVEYMAAVVAAIDELNACLLADGGVCVYTCMYVYTFIHTYVGSSCLCHRRIRRVFAGR